MKFNEQFATWIRNRLDKEKSLLQMESPNNVESRTNTSTCFADLKNPAGIFEIGFDPNIMMLSLILSFNKLLSNIEILCF